MSTLTLTFTVTFTVTIIIITFTFTFTFTITTIIIITQRKAHGLQRAPEVLAIMPPRALHDAVLQVQHARAPLLQQGDDKTQERPARRATGRV